MGLNAFFKQTSIKPKKRYTLETSSQPASSIYCLFHFLAIETLFTSSCFCSWPCAALQMTDMATAVFGPSLSSGCGQLMGMAMYLQGAMSDRCGLSFPAVVPCLRPPNACVVKSGERNVIQAYECTAVEIGEVNHCKVRKY